MVVTVAVRLILGELMVFLDNGEHRRMVFLLIGKGYNCGVPSSYR